MHKKLSLIWPCLLVLLISCGTPEPVSTPTDLNWDYLIDAELSQWDRYLSFKHKLGYDGSPPQDENGNAISPIGLNPVGYNAFTTLEEEGEVVIRVDGEYYGCLVTKNEFENYHLQLQFKWGEKKWVPRKQLLKDSGILYHGIGELGVEHWRSWMLSQEFQIMEGHTGDYWSQATSAIDIRAYTPESVLNPMAHESQDFLHIGEGGPYSGYCLRSENHENPHGEWNTLDLICYQDKSLHIVNGEVVMILQNSRYLDSDSVFQPLTKGKIQLQSEAAELFFKGIKIRNIDSLTTEQRAYF